jgi:hypothetical protein
MRLYKSDQPGGIEPSHDKSTNKCNEAPTSIRPFPRCGVQFIVLTIQKSFRKKRIETTAGARIPLSRGASFH